jgi:hypothetical protein
MCARLPTPPPAAVCSRVCLDPDVTVCFIALLPADTDKAAATLRLTPEDFGFPLRQRGFEQVDDDEAGEEEGEEEGSTNPAAAAARSKKAAERALTMLHRIAARTFLRMDWVSGGRGWGGGGCALNCVGRRLDGSPTVCPAAASQNTLTGAGNLRAERHPMALAWMDGEAQSHFAAAFKSAVPGLIALNPRRKTYAVMRGSLQAANVYQFIQAMLEYGAPGQEAGGLGKRLDPDSIAKRVAALIRLETLPSGTSVPVLNDQGPPPAPPKRGGSGGGTGKGKKPKATPTPQPEADKEEL